MSQTTTNAATGVTARCGDQTMQEAERLAKRVAPRFTDARRRYLRGRAPKSMYAHNTRRKMDTVGAGRVRPLEMLLAVSIADQDDGVPTEAVVAPYLEIVEILRARSGSGEPKVRVLELPMLPLVQRTERAESELTQAESELLACPESSAAMDHVLTAAERAEAAESRLSSEVRARRARCTVAQVAGAR